MYTMHQIIFGSLEHREPVDESGKNVITSVCHVDNNMIIYANVVIIIISIFIYDRISLRTIIVYTCI